MKNAEELSAPFAKRSRTIKSEFRWDFTPQILSDESSSSNCEEIILDRKQLVKLLKKHLPSEIRVNSSATFIGAILSITIED